MNGYCNPLVPDNLTWTHDESDSMILVIKYNGVQVMRLSLHEAIECAGRKAIMKHVAECDRSPWLSKWGADDEIIDRLKNGLK